jgi:hypothetical protein
MLASEKPTGASDGKLKHDSWRNVRTGPISRSSIGRFREMPQEIQEKILTELAVFRICKGHAKQMGLRHRSCEEVCEALGYAFEPRVYSKWYARVYADWLRDWMRRTRRGMPTGGLRYPAYLAWRP